MSVAISLEFPRIHRSWCISTGDRLKSSYKPIEGVNQLTKAHKH